MWLAHRGAGILLHPTSLPAPFGVGDLGPSADRWLNFLAAGGLRYWQVLPLNQPDVVGSPYSSSSAMAASLLLISPELLAGDGLLEETVPWSAENSPVHYRSAERWKSRILKQAFVRFSQLQPRQLVPEFRSFRRRHQWWLHDYTLFEALKEHFGQSVPWTHWPAAIRSRRVSAVRHWQTVLANRIEYFIFVQWQFERQWQRLRTAASRRGIAIIGDLPLFATRDSVDTWADPKNFLLDRFGRPRLVAGVPPDYFSRRGQIWGNPLYNWTHMKRERFRWWIERFRRAFQWYDIVRLDHFRGYRAAWGVRSKSRTSAHGSWHTVPGDELFAAVRRRLPHAHFVAEDLGIITPDVVDLRNRLEIPGVRVLQFGFAEPWTLHGIANVARRSVVYTGTHDNDTTRGWLEKATRRERANFRESIGPIDGRAVWRLISAALQSRANTIIVPLQDWLNLGSEARMNTPGKRKGNWQWRLSPPDLSGALARKIKKMIRQTRRR